MLPDTITTFIIYGLGLYLAYFAVNAIYRVTLHPLAHIPGPRLASITYLYEWYHDIYHIGRFPWKLRDLHEKYGPLNNPFLLYLPRAVFTDVERPHHPNHPR
jgi:hypothetical protein